MALKSDIHLSELIPKLRKHVQKIMEHSDDIETIDDLELQLRFWFSKKYSIPMYSPELDAYDVRMMLMEHYMHTYTPPTAEETVRNSGESLADMIAKEFSDDEHRAMDQMFDDDWSFKDTNP